MNILLQEMKDNALVPFILPNLFWIMRNKMQPSDVEKHVLPTLTPVFTMKRPLQCLDAILDAADMLREKIPSGRIKDSTCVSCHRFYHSSFDTKLCYNPYFLPWKLIIHRSRLKR